MNVLSLFDGINCGKVALERAGIKVDSYFSSEIDPYAIQINKKNHPNVVHLGDVTKWREWNLPKIDLIIGGSPCQGFSVAGKKLNFDDPRSKLFFEFAKIVDSYKPKNFLLENVRMKKESEQIITDYMGVEPIKINSALVSAQNRVRLYWTNIPNVTQPEDKGILLKDILLPDAEVDPRMITKDGKSFCLTSTYNGAVAWNSIERKQRTMVRRIGHIGNGGQGERIYSPDGKSVSLSANGGGRGAKTGLYLIGDDVRKLDPIECERLQTLPDNYTEGVSNTQRYKMLGNGWTVDVIAHIFKGLR